MGQAICRKQLQPCHIQKTGDLALVHQVHSQQENASAKELAEYDAFYIGNADEKTIYLTFDCGYENGNTDCHIRCVKKT